MNIYNTMELSKIYKRILNVEILLKDRIKSALITTYPKQEFNRIFNYVNTVISRSKYKYKKNGRNNNKIDDILNLKIEQKEKLNYLFNTIYLSDTLKILTDYAPIYKDRNFKNNFYINIPYFSTVQQNASNLKKLRNAIMHFNYDNYYKNKKEYLSSLSFWERLLDCSLSFVHELPNIKPTTTNILKLIKENYPDTYTENDRLVVDVFDDIAFINGVSINKLPKYWTIGRQWYKIKTKP